MSDKPVSYIEVDLKPSGLAIPEKSTGNRIENTVISSIPIPNKPQNTFSTGFVQKAVDNPGITYNQAGITYNEIGVAYGGIYGTDGQPPQIQSISQAKPTGTNKQEKPIVDTIVKSV